MEVRISGDSGMRKDNPAVRGPGGLRTSCVDGSLQVGTAWEEVFTSHVFTLSVGTKSD